jgi:hypothetical protein
MSELTLTQIAADPFVQTGLLAAFGAMITRVLGTRCILNTQADFICELWRKC